MKLNRLMTGGKVKRMSMLWIIVACIMMWIGSATASERASVPAAHPKNMPSALHRVDPIQVLSATPMRCEILQSDVNSTQLAISEPEFTIGSVNLGGSDYSTVRMDGEGSTFQPGIPDLPRVTRLIMVGNTGQIHASVVSENHRVEALDHPPAPVQSADNPNDFIAPRADVYSRNDWYPENIVEVSEPATLRDVRFVILVIYPVQVNPVTGEMRVYDDINISVENLGGVGINEITWTPTSISPSFKKLYTQFENFENSPLDELPVIPGKHLYICADNASVTTEVNKLVTWRRKKGIDASYVTLTTVGGSDETAIRNYISSQYIASGGQLEFVTMVGDPSASGEYLMNTGSSQYDNTFGAMGGGPNPDPVPDIAVGRFPVETLTQLQAMVAKSINYEADPYVADTTWFTRAWCGAHTSWVASNASMKQYTRQIMLQHGMRTVNFDVFPGGMDATLLENRIDQGVCVFNDRMSWISEFTSSQLDGLANGRKLPFVMVITCDTGTFTWDALSEEWVRRGTMGTPVGAIGCVGLAGAGTHVPFNNIVDSGVMFGLYVLGIREQGIALIEGKLQLYKNYWEYGETGSVNSFCYWANLMGDPAVPIWMKAPKSVTVGRPSSVARSTNNIAITVTRSGNPIENALVGLYKGTETFVRGYTDANGSINLPVNLPTTGYLNVTITGDDVDSYVDSIQVTAPAQSLSYHSVAVDDDNSGGTVGDANGVLNPGETADLTIRLQNTGTSTTVTGITGTLTCSNPGITIVSGSQSYPNIAVGANAAPGSPFRIQVGAVDDSVAIPLLLNLTSSAGTQTVRVDMIPRAGDVTFMTSAFLDGNSRLDPGDIGSLTVTINNTGGRILTSAEGVLRSLDSHINVSDSLGTYGNVAIGSDATNSANTFAVAASGLTVGGYQAQMELLITDANGQRDSVRFAQTIGAATTTTPTGPDGYGYYAYDNTETQPGGTASQYAWTEIAPGLGGSGTSLGFTDGSEDGDQVAYRRLPFSFTFYGQTFDSISICSNGWLAFGVQNNIDFRNYRIGSPIGPSYQIAAYWDDLIVTGIANGGVFTWQDAINNRYIVEWRTRTLWSGVDEVFQIILFDPADYSSPTGDGKILVQYQTCTPSINDGSNDNDWCTVGIQNGDHSVGLEYCYWNTYPASAAPLGNLRSVMYTTDISGYLQPPLTLVSPNGGGTMRVNTTTEISWFGGTSGGNVAIDISRSGSGGPWEAIVASTANDGSYIYTVTGPASSTCRIRVRNVALPSEYDISDADFAIGYLQVLSPNGGETWFMDSTATVSWSGGAPDAQIRIELSRHALNGPWQMLAASVANSGSYSLVAVPPTTDSCRIRVTSLSDANDTDVSDNDFSVRALQMIITESFESGGTGWTHTTVGGQWVDNWHISIERAHTGSSSYKCGDSGTGNYANYCDAYLLSPVITDLAADATLEFHYQVESELSGAFPDSAYDGGVLEISADGGGFQALTPGGGYPKIFRLTAGTGQPFTGPMPGRPCWAGTVTTWTPVVVDLSAYAGQDIQLRWRFGSDQATTREGWYVDDVVLYAPLVHIEPLIPTQVTVTLSGSDLILRWQADGNIFYRIYTSNTPGGPYELLTSTTETEYTIIGGAAESRKFYYVVGWDSN